MDQNRPATNRSTNIDFRDLRSVEQIRQANPAMRGGTIHRWIFYADDYGFSPCVVRIGRKVYIHEGRFNRWLADHLGRAA